MFETPVINILTRTSNRPNGLNICRESIKNQVYKNVNHLVSYESDLDIVGLDDNLTKVKVIRYEGEAVVHPDGLKFAYYNLYCNELLSKVTDGWIMFLDDDDNLLHNKVLLEIALAINRADENTLFIWQMRYPNGKTLPNKNHFNRKLVEQNHIGSPCFIFHSKYKEFATWDQWKASDFRVINRLHKVIPKTIWLQKVFIQINNFGDLGNRNDVSSKVKRKLIFDKNILWYFIPKYHTQIAGIFIFHSKTYTKIFKKIFSKISI